MASHLHTMNVMQRSLVAVILVGLGLLAGCAGEERVALDPSSDPAFIPPGQGDLEIGADPVVKEKRAPRARKVQEPNHSEHKMQAKSR